MVTIGVDAHTCMHAAVAVDADGRILGEWQGLNSPSGWQALWTWAAAFSAPRQWGIEGAWKYGRSLAQYLVAGNERVYEVNPRWTSQRRRRARKRGKSDRLDAHAVAQLVREDGPTLPQIPLVLRSVTSQPYILPRSPSCVASSCSRPVPLQGFLGLGSALHRKPNWRCMRGSLRWRPRRLGWSVTA